MVMDFSLTILISSKYIDWPVRQIMCTGFFSKCLANSSEFQPNTIRLTTGA